MTPRMWQGCAMVLLLAMMLAMAAGLMVGGPIVIAPHDHALAASRSSLGVAHAAHVLACLPLAAIGAWGWRAAWNSPWPAELRTSWLAFFGICIATAAVAASYHLAPSDVGLALVHLFVAAATTALTLAFMAERVDALFGRNEAVAAACAVAGCAGLWWFAGHWVGGVGDLRALVFLECLPLLLVPAGALSLPGGHSRAADWLAVLGMYIVARAAAFADAWAPAAEPWISGHALMFILLAAMAACPAYRIAMGSRGPTSWAPSRSEPTQRSTSLNTSS